MRITVLGGSPKGEKSVTMQYIKYLQLHYSEVEFDVKQPAFRIRRLEQSPEVFDEIIEAVRQSDAVLWAFPLYTHSVCSQYLRFIELINERKAGAAFAGKPAAALSTSIHFFDHTAHGFIRAVSEDLGMSFISSHSAKMDDLIKKEGQTALKGFFEIFIDAVENGFPATHLYPRLLPRLIESKNNSAADPAAIEPVMTGKKICIVTDSTDGTLGAMIEHFCSVFRDKIEIVDLRTIKIAGGCMGCLHCGAKNICRYGNTDEVMQTYIEKVYPADVYVIAATITGRWYSSLMKAFIDRGFFNTHQPFMGGKQAAILLDGDISSNPALMEGLTGYVEWQGGSLNGFASSTGPDTAVKALARQVILALKKDYHRPISFLGVGAIKIFRDDIYTQLGIMFPADFKYYKKHGIFKTLPHKQPLKLLMYRFMKMVTAFPPIRRWIKANMRDFLLMPYRAVIKDSG